MGNQISESVMKAVKKFMETANNMKLDKSVINGLFIKGDQISRGEELVNKAEKKLNDWGIFGSKYHDAAHLLYKAVDCFKLAQSWDRVGAVYVKLASCYLKDEWRTPVLLKVKEALKAKELESKGLYHVRLFYFVRSKLVFSEQKNL